MLREEETAKSEGEKKKIRPEDGGLGS